MEQQERIEQLATILKRARQAKGLSARQLSEAAGVHRRTIALLEEAQILQPKALKLTHIAEVLDLDPTDLLTLAGYESTKRLPGLGVYLRTTTALPDEAIQELDGYVQYLHSKYGVDPNGPNHGEDEADI